MLPMQPRMPQAFIATMAHCWLMVTWLSTGTPSSSLAKLLSSQLSPACIGAGHRLSLCWITGDYWWPISPACQGLSECQQNNFMLISPNQEGFSLHPLLTLIINVFRKISGHTIKKKSCCMNTEIVMAGKSNTFGAHSTAHSTAEI